jgi:hypothetical protein
MTRSYYIPNQRAARPDPKPSENMLKNRARKLADRTRIANDCRFIPAAEWAAGKRFPKRSHAHREQAR